MKIIIPLLFKLYILYALHYKLKILPSICTIISNFAFNMHNILKYCMKSVSIWKAEGACFYHFNSQEEKNKKFVGLLSLAVTERFLVLENEQIRTK